jgi:hypothetical protein
MIWGFVVQYVSLFNWLSLSVISESQNVDLFLGVYNDRFVILCLFVSFCRCILQENCTVS